MNEKKFLKNPYLGADGEDFKKEFTEYLEDIIKSNRWEAMSDYTLFLQGAKQALNEVIEELKK